MRNNTTRYLVLSGLFVGIGLLLPIVFHAFGLGKTFLPMHIPVLLAGFVLPVPYAAMVGALTPFLSSVLTSMPPFFPMMPTMVAELMVYAIAASLLRMHANVYVALFVSMVFGRVASGVAVWALLRFFSVQLPAPAVWIASAVSTGVPGIVVQLVFIPPIVYLLKKSNITA